MNECMRLSYTRLAKNLTSAAPTAKMTYEMCSLPTKIPQSPEKSSISQLAESLNLPLRETPGKVPELWENQQFRTPI